MVSYNEPESEILTGLLFCMGLSIWHYSAFFHMGRLFWDYVLYWMSQR